MGTVVVYSSVMILNKIKMGWFFKVDESFTNVNRIQYLDTRPSTSKYKN